MKTKIFQKIYKTKIKDRKILLVEGSDKIDFLQNIISNNIELVSKFCSIYSTLLSPQGKFLFDFIIFRGTEDKNLYIDCHESRCSDLVKLLNLYMLRKNIKISSTNINEVTLIYGNCEKLFQKLNLKPSEGFTQIINNNIFTVDPRSKNLGIRIYSFNKILPSEILDIAFKPKSKYEKTRINSRIPDGNMDLEIGKSFLIENNFESLNAIDFNKGCYIGQENTARQKYRGTSKRLLAKIEICGPKIPIGQEIIINNKKVGTIRSSEENIGLAIKQKKS